MRKDNYPLASNPDEITRLRIQAESLAGEAAIMFDRIGLRAGMSCLDLGCGAGGVTDLLAARVAPGGRVVGLDVDEFSLAAARAWADGLGLRGVTFRRGSIFDNDLASASFDLVHLRYVITTIGRHAEVARAALRLVSRALSKQPVDGQLIDVVRSRVAVAVAGIPIGLPRLVLTAGRMRRVVEAARWRRGGN